ncbi:MAG: sensor histidine kinase, partial [Sphingomonas sp.]
QGWGWLDPVHPDDRERALAQWQLAPSQGRYEAEYRIRDAATGDYHWFQTRAAPVRDVNGRIIEWLGTSTDIHDLRQLQERQQLLVAELQHRVRNILTVVRSVFARTVETGRSIEEIADHFKGRLDAMARTQAVVTQTASGTVDLENLIRDELLSVGITDGVRLSISGPDLPLPASVAESIGLAIHELTTNAVKYGALRESGGQVDIHWEINLVEQGQRRLTLIWREQGVPAVGMKPAHHGFGRELIERALPYRLGAETQLEFRGGGVRCSISLLLPDDGQVAQIEWGR